MHDFSLLKFIPLFNQLDPHIAMTFIVIIVCVLGALFARKHLNTLVNQNSIHADAVLVPARQLNYLNFFEIVAENLYNLTKGVIGQRHASQFFPLVGSLFVFIFGANLIGLIPGFPPATDNLNTTLGLGIFVFFYYNYAGFRANGWGYIKHFFGPVIWLSPLMLVIEIVSHLFRPLSLALRLRGNIMGDHIILGVFSDLVPILLPTLFYGLGVFVAFMQAFVFCLMTMVYILLSTSHDH